MSNIKPTHLVSSMMSLSKSKRICKKINKATKGLWMRLV